MTPAANLNETPSPKNYTGEVFIYTISALMSAIKPRGLLVMCLGLQTSYSPMQKLSRCSRHVEFRERKYYEFLVT